tara:strand:- start:4118 stop:4252 length:135 start_codon:yes stop_codon:yes gene_type:complete
MKMNNAEDKRTGRKQHPPTKKKEREILKNSFLKTNASALGRREK